MSIVLQAQGATPKVTTVAGGYWGDGKPATSASFTTVWDVATDKKGNIYIGDDCRIRKINKLGVISTFAGTGICGFGGDGGPRKSAMIRGAGGLAFDGQGNLFFSDIRNSRIRKIDVAGIVTTIAGNGINGYSGDGGPAINASLSSPHGIAIDSSGNLLIADYSNFVIRMVDSAGIIHTVAGNHTSGFSGDGGPATSAQLSTPMGVAADSAGNVYIGDVINYRVRRVDAAGVITTYAGNGWWGNLGNGGPANLAAIGITYRVLLGGNNLYISTQGNIWAVDLGTHVATIICGAASGYTGFNGDGGPALSASISAPQGMSSDHNGNLLFADLFNLRVRRIDGSQTISTIAGGYIGDGVAPKTASLNVVAPGGMAFDSLGNLYFADTDNHRVRKVSTAGVITTIAGNGNSGYSGDGGPATAASLNTPRSVVVDGSGNVFIADRSNYVIRKVDTTGTISTYIKTVNLPGITGPPYPEGMSMDASGNIYAVSDWGVVLKITSDGGVSIVAGVPSKFGYNGDGIPATQAYLFLPSSVATDVFGNVYIADTDNERIRKVDVNGIISTVAGDGTEGFGGDGGPATMAHLNIPWGVTVDSKGKLFIADSWNGRVRAVDTNGTITTLAGTGQFGYNGNGLAATSTNMFPGAVAIGPKGWVYLSDVSSQRVRAVH